MLFDLTATGRRRTVKVVYVLLAVLFLAGALIGIGSGYDLGDVFGGGGDATSQFEKEVQKYERQVQTNPNNANAWALLAQARYQEVTSGGGYNQDTQQFTQEGRADLGQVDRAWRRYLALSPEQPNADVAALMVNTYALGLNKPGEAAAAQEIVAEARPSAAAFKQLALLAYGAGQTRKGDLAAEKALDETPKDLQGTLKEQLDGAKKSGQQQAASGGQTTTPVPGSATGE
jgi:tetratricopeptide (TPR) repeat protein